ncbi:polysaccharide biosynthesis tyrosine autokinase [Mucilaginibacter sp. KACC 22773]|uniref:GumC family protein n=1 Tax=Mucilaginibacter sp. KACC 22773 TaxID=3025671 RepID=UPI002366D977|nr:tyrosine-protein kinase family protein [Mucilaginibacter sp. KACC 22773]WDF75683.1 polysaccharide biosynthesis tyrosine autokinase [Mucilaginibacter sp. KACC 22773]
MLKKADMDINAKPKQTLPGGDFKTKAMPYLKNWYAFLAGLFVCLLVAWGYLHYVTPRYKITSTLLIPDDKKGDGILKATAFSDLNMFQEAKTVDNEIEVLRSKDLIYNVFERLNLEVSYFDEAAFKTKEYYGDDRPFIVTVVKLSNGAYLKKLHLQNYSGDKFLLTVEKKSWLYRYGQVVNHKDCAFKVEKGPGFATTDKQVTIRFNNLKTLAALYSAGLLQVNPVIKESNTLLLSINDAVPERGVAILNNIISTYNDETVKKKNITALNTILFIDKRLKTMEDDLSAAEKDIETYKQQSGASEINAGNQVNLTKSAEYNQLLEESNVQLGIVKSMEFYLNQSGNQFNAVPSTMGLKDPVLNSLVSRFNDLQLERNRMLNTANLSNPLVQDLSRQIASLRTNIKENLTNIKKGFMIGHTLLKQNSAQYDSRIQSVPAIERGLLQRSREQGVKTNLYQYLLQKREETALSLSATIPSSQIVDRPAYDPVPEFPKEQLTYLLGGVIGLLIPGFSIFFRQKFNAKVTTTANLLEIPGVRVLGELSHNQELAGAIAVHKGRTTVISELFRYIRSNIGILNQGLPQKTILVTSTMKGEGKTFFSVNLGITLALLSKRVLIIEFDLRRPDLLKSLNLAQTKGVADYIEGDIDSLYEYIQPVGESDNLFVLGCGTLSERPSELLMDARVEQLFDWCKAQFDYIIVDTSPVGAVSDALSLASFADLSIYLVRYNYTSTQQLDILKDIYDNGKLKNIMVVLNDAKKQNRDAYAYGGYGYVPYGV